MSKRYPGNFITGNPVALSQSSNSGIFDLKDQYQATTNGTWQEGDGVYEIPGSLRFRTGNGNYLARTISSTAGSQTTWTYSFWMKRGSFNNSVQRLLYVGNGSNNEAGLYLTSDRLQYEYYNVTYDYYLRTNRLLRDPSAWYHVVVVADTTNSVANDRLRIYINGTREVDLAANSMPSQNYAMRINEASQTHLIGTRSGGSDYFDGLLSEINFIDGLALDPSYFGVADPITNIWQPKPYTGGYGYNGYYILGNNNQTIYANYFGASSSGQYLTTAYSTDFALTNQDFTIEAFIYANEYFTQNDHGIFNFGENVTSVNGKSLIVTGYNSGAGQRMLRIAASSDGSTNDLINYVDIGQIEIYTWNHLAVCRNAGNISVYINGKRTYTYNIGATSLYNQTTYGLAIGNYRNNGSFGGANWPGAISNARVTIGQCLYSGTVITVPKAQLTTTSQGAISSNVKLLCCQSASATQDNSQYARTLTNNGTTSFVDYSYALTDMSGNGNSWGFNGNMYVLNVGTNRSLANWDILTDSPVNVFTSATDTGGVVSGNYCVWNPLATTTSGGTTPLPIDGNINMNFTNVGQWQRVMGSQTIPPTGKYYWEITISQVVSNISGTNSFNYLFGIANTAPQNFATYGNDGAGATYLSWWIDAGTPKTVVNQSKGSGTSYGSVPTNGQILMVAVDMDNNKIYWGLNGTWFNSGNPVTGANPGLSGQISSSYSYVPVMSAYAYNGVQNPLQTQTNFGQRPFAYTPPTGFVSLNTTNIQATGPSSVGKAAQQPNKWFDVNVWGGTGYQMDITNAGGFAPDLVWEKCLSTTYPHLIVDSARGAPSRLIPNTTAVEADEPTNIYKLNSDGFTVGTNAVSNTNGYRNVGWQWKQSPNSGFNIVTWAGNGAARSISHNLGVAPKFMIVKQRDVTTRSWAVYHSGLSNPQAAFYLDSNAAPFAYTAFFNSQTPDSSSIYIGTDATVNASGANYIAYVWAEVPGFSKFGSYYSSGLTDGPFINCGFKPKWILVREGTLSSGNLRDWLIWDAARTPYNGYSTSEFASGAQAIAALQPYTGTPGYSDAIDIVSNGFKFKNAASPNYNGSGGSYVYAAFAESPFALNNRAR
jgi:hypothetical protein